MNLWFYRLEKRNKNKILNYLETLSQHVSNPDDMVQAMMKKTTYNHQFCTECVQAWSDGQKAVKAEPTEEEGFLF